MFVIVFAFVFVKGGDQSSSFGGHPWLLAATREPIWFSWFFVIFGWFSWFFFIGVFFWNRVCPCLCLFLFGGHPWFLAATREPIAASYRPLEPTRDANHDINSPYLVSHRSNFNPVEISVGFAVSEQFLYFLASPHLAAVGTSPIRGKEMGEENLFPNLCPVCELSAS